VKANLPWRALALCLALAVVRGAAAQGAWHGGRGPGADIVPPRPFGPRGGLLRPLPLAGPYRIFHGAGLPPRGRLVRRPPDPRDLYGLQRRIMVQQQLLQRGISQPEVLAAMAQVPRQLFLPERMRTEAYSDRALQVGPNRTIYQPYVVALMTSLLDLKQRDTVLEVGTGTGYHAAVLSRIAARVYSIEIDPVVASQAGKLLAVMGYHNVEVWAGDGYGGLPEKAPFDAILLSTAPPRIPQPLIDQLRVGGRMVVPVGNVVQDLVVISKTAQGIERRTVGAVRVSPMTGHVQNAQ
jgi:protein-L-isoaspartate(D-aspartate) O-methyltransferase